MYSILIWNDFIFANTFISDTSAKTVAMGLKDYVGAIVITVFLANGNTI